jgi:hypothetical protein
LLRRDLGQGPIGILKSLSPREEKGRYDPVFER